jgi:preprotein translocase subunit SecE
VRAEARKITWTPWKETWITSLMVFAMVVITGIFFLVVDQILSHGMQFLLRLAS